MKTDDFDFYLPEELIAQTPLEKRDSSRLLVLDKKTGEINHRHFTDIIDYMEEGDTLVLNDTKVMPARLYGVKEETLAVVEVLLLKDEGDNEKKCYKRLHRWRYSPTAAYGNNEVHIHPFLPRRISVAEALAIQSLPASFVIPEDITLTDAFKTIGNGVPYLAAKGIALNIYDYIHNH